MSGIQQTTTKKNLGEKTCETCGHTYQAFSQVIAGQEMFFDYCWPCKKKEEDAKLAHGIQERNEKLKGLKLVKLFNQHSFINDNLRTCSFGNYEKQTKMQDEAFMVARKYVETFDLQNPKNLIMTGSYGVGKSHLSIAIIKALINKGHTGIFVSTPKLLQAFRDTYQKDSEVSEGQLMKALEKVDCLVLDDIGAENTTDWATDKLFNIVDSRQGKNTVFTTNLTMEQLETKIGPRNFSRIMMNANVEKMVGKDYRKG